MNKTIKNIKNIRFLRVYIILYAKRYNYFINIIFKKKFSLSFYLVFLCSYLNNIRYYFRNCFEFNKYNNQQQ